MSEVRVERSNLTLERMALAGIAALIAWNVYTTSELKTDVAVGNATIKALEATVTASQIDRYTRSEANSDRALLEQRIARLEQWTERLSNRIKDVEDKTR